jgi:hypothetical protein
VISLSMMGHEVSDVIKEKHRQSWSEVDEYGNRVRKMSVVFGMTGRTHTAESRNKMRLNSRTTWTEAELKILRDSQSVIGHGILAGRYLANCRGSLN